jgi:hypothetical protein
MPEAGFESLRLELLQSGVDTLYVERTIAELREHYLDLRDEGVAAGLSAEEAASSARATLGADSLIAAAVLARPELKSFSMRWPRVAHCLHSAATIGALPGLPLLFCIEHRPELARWSMALGGAATLMGGVLAGLNYLILLV